MTDRQRMTTRSRASTGTAKITDVAANIQQASREAQASAAAAASTRQKSSIRMDVGRDSADKRMISTDDINACRNWLISREIGLQQHLEGEYVSHNDVVTPDERREFGIIQALRIHAENICGKLATSRLTSVETSLIYEQLASIISYVSSRKEK